jgi:riboflavin synthase
MAQKYFDFKLVRSFTAFLRLIRYNRVMFTGIITELGKVSQLKISESGAEFTIAAPKTAKGLKLGDSVAINGACHTVVRKTPTAFTVQSIPETLQRTSLGTLAQGSRVNLERPLRAGGSLDGHIVTGHIDTTAQIVKITPQGNSHLFEFAVSASIARLLVEKGSVALDGISLTVIKATKSRLTVGIIPHTLAVTTLGDRRVGDLVNLEADILAKHVAKLTNKL